MAENYNRLLASAYFVLNQVAGRIIQHEHIRIMKQR